MVCKLLSDINNKWTSTTSLKKKKKKTSEKWREQDKLPLCVKWQTFSILSLSTSIVEYCGQCEQ